MKQAGSSNIFSLKSRLKRLKRDTNRWSIFTLAIVLFIALPVIAIAVKLLEGPGETWWHLVDNLLVDYIGNSFFLVFTCSFLVLVMGLGAAWLVARFEFPFRKQLEWLLILPLAIPSYIVAYAYAGVFDYGGSLELILRWLNLEFIRIDIMNKFGLAFVLSISLFPYVYVSSRAFFLNQAGNLLEASTMLGVGEFKSFFRLMLPLARPAIIAGLILVLMEVLNDYGAAQYFGSIPLPPEFSGHGFHWKNPKLQSTFRLCLFLLFLPLFYSKNGSERIFSLPEIKPPGVPIEN